MLRYDLNDLRIFLALTRTLNIAQAAEYVGLTASAVSLRLKKLEETFGVQLFIREPKGLVLTQAGIALQEEASRLSAGAAELDARMRAFTDDSSRELVVASNTAGLQNYFAAYISQYLKKYPGRCRFLECPSHYAVEAVREGSADVGFGLITARLRKDRDIMVREVALDHHVLITPPDHALAGRDTIAYADSLHYPQITPSHQSPMAAAMKERASASGTPLLPMIQLPSFELIIKVVSEGSGVAVVPESALSDQMRACVAVVRLSDAWAVRPLGFFLPAARAPSSRALALVEEFFRFNAAAHKL